MQFKRTRGRVCTDAFMPHIWSMFRTDAADVLRLAAGTCFFIHADTKRPFASPVGDTCGNKSLNKSWRAAVQYYKRPN
jgi:hypothetical protein